MQSLTFFIFLYGLLGPQVNGFGFGFGSSSSYPYCPSPYFAYYPAYPQQDLGFFDSILQAILGKKGIDYPPSPSFAAIPVPIPQPVYYPLPPAPPKMPAIRDHIVELHITMDSKDEEEHHHHHDHGHKKKVHWHDFD